MNAETAISSDTPLREVALPATDQCLREDVNRLGALVGEILAEQRGEDFLALVERVRVAAILRREAEAPADELAAQLDGIDPETAEAVVRAFATYFNAVNLAERVHRIRRRRDYQRDGNAPQPGGLVEALSKLKAEGVTRAELDTQLARLRIEPVFTAHPTEAVRRALLEKEQEVVRCLVEDMDRTLTPQERRADVERMRTAFTAAWQTAESPPERPTVADELEHVGFYLSDVLYRVLPVFYEMLEDALDDVFGRDAASKPLPTVLRFGSWVGGDMDGNPNVGADTIAASLASQRGAILSAYRRDLAKLGSVLSQSTTRVAVSQDVLDRIDTYRAQFPDAAASIRARHADMPYRNLLTLMAARLEATELDVPLGYDGPDGFVADLELIGRSLVTHRGEHAGGFALRRVLWRARTFGFHLATLDVRQDSSVHTDALAVCLDDAEFAAQSPAERVKRLTAVLADTAPPTTMRDTDIAAAEPTLAVFRTLAQARERYGAAALGPYIVSMSRSAADALAVLALARCAGDTGRNIPIDVAPLFETVADLEAAPEVLTALLSEPRYSEHLRARGNRQVVMLGYSDSSKDAGMMASRWALQQAQIALFALGREYGVRVEFFHGRGGSISRGGGKTERAVIAAPRGTVDGLLRVTEQGEVIHRKYGIRALALRNLEQSTGAVLRATLRPRAPELREAAWRARLREMAQVSRDAYRALVHEDVAFRDYFRAATPIDLIEKLRLGSRPPKRKGAGDVGSLRAIPWVFAWSLNRCGLTGWYGVGAGLRHGIETWGLEAMAEMARDWPFFAALVDDLEMVLAKSDLEIFTEYSRLAGPLHEAFFPRIESEFDRARDAVLALKGAEELLSGDTRLRLSIRLRNPYVDPINLLQVELLERWRANERPDDADYRALVATVNGISAGVQNTG